MSAPADIESLDEATRIIIIGTTAEAGAQIAVGCADHGEANHLVAALEKDFKVKEVARGPGPRGTLIVRIGPK